MQTSSSKNKRSINVFLLAMLNVSIMASLRSLPLIAGYGLSSLAFFLVVTTTFLIPSALISAELATGWPKSGGIYIWVREAFGDRWGLFAVWMQWVHNISWYPVILSFVATTLGYTFSPGLAENKVYVFLVILIGFWGMTLLNYYGIKTATWFSTIGVIAGTIFPGILIIGFGLYWGFSGRPLQIELSWKGLLPNFSDINNIAFLAGLFLSFMGLEVSAAHAGYVKDPHKNYPRAIILAAIITLSIFMLGSLSLAFVLPNLALVTGVVEAFQIFLRHYGLDLFFPVIALLLAFGAIAEVNSWIVGPVQALFVTSLHGNLPPVFQHRNHHGVPTYLLLFQAIVVSITSLVILYLPSVSASFWILSAMSAQLYLIAYIFMFAAAIRLKYTKPHVPRAYQVPFHIKGIWTCGILGILSSSFALLVSFIPPGKLEVGSIFFYECCLLGSVFVMSVIPLGIYACRKPHWVHVPNLKKKESHYTK